MNKQQYVDSLVAAYRLANLADSDSDARADWMLPIYSRTHCNALYGVLATMLDEKQLRDLIDDEPVIV